VYVNLAKPAKVNDNDQRTVQTQTSAAQNIADTSENLASSPDSSFFQDIDSTEDRGRSGDTNPSVDESPALESVKVVNQSTEMSAVTQTPDEQSNEATTQRKPTKISKICHLITNCRNTFITRAHPTL